MTLPYVPQVSTITPSAAVRLATAAVRAASGLARGGVDELDRDHGAAAADVADAGVGGLRGGEPVEQQRADLAGPLDEPAVLEVVERGERRGARDGVAGVRAAEPARVRRRP